MLTPRTRNPVIIEDFEKRAKRLRLGKADGFIRALWKVFAITLDTTLYYEKWSDAYSRFVEAYQELCGYSATNCESFDEFFCPKLTSVLNDYFGKKETERIRDECVLAMECPYSKDEYRPSYRSKRAGDYANIFFSIIINAIDFPCYGLELEEALKANTVDGFMYGNDAKSNRIALALRQKN